MMVSSAISTTKIDVAKNLNEFSKFMFLWKEDRDSQIQVSAHPLQPFYTGYLVKYLKAGTPEYNAKEMTTIIWIKY